MTNKDELREQVEAAVAVAFARNGEAMSNVAIVRAFSGRGASVPTLYRWVRMALAKGAGLPPAASVEDRDPVESPALSRGVVSALPVLPYSTSYLAAGALPALTELRECISAAQQVMVYARKADGTVRNPRLLLAASENIRRAVESSVKLQDTVMDLIAVERFHKAIFDMLLEESPAFARRVVERLEELNTDGRFV